MKHTLKPKLATGLKSYAQIEGGEFLSQQMISHQDQKGTIQELTVHDSSSQNGVAERGMHT